MLKDGKGTDSILKITWGLLYFSYILTNMCNTFKSLLKNQLYLNDPR